MRGTLVPSSTRRSFAVLLGAMLLALALVVLASAAAPKKADAATKVVTKTFSNAQLITIPEGAPTTTIGPAAPYPSEKSIAAFPAGSHIRDVNLTLKNYTHTVPEDVDVLLAHNGRNRTVMSDAGGANAVSNITLVLDDEAAASLPNQDQIVAGRFKPRNFESFALDSFPAPAPTQDVRASLSGFDGQGPNGTWKLFVQDDSFLDVGRFGGGWSITIKAAVPA